MREGHFIFSLTYPNYPVSQHSKQALREQPKDEPTLSHTQSCKENERRYQIGRIHRLSLSKKRRS